MGLNPSNLIAQAITGKEVFPNMAGHEEADSVCHLELETAGIKVNVYEFMRTKGEVPTAVLGSLGPWSFRRAWYYWVATGPGIPPKYAEELHLAHGKEVRVDGHCGCPSPREWFGGFAVGNYHVDTQDGLNALAETIRKVMAEA